MQNELDKLEQYLKDNGYHFHRIDRPCQFPYPKAAKIPKGFGETHQIVVFDEKGCRLWDAICHWGSYGYEEGLLEIYGNIVTEDAEDLVEGYLTAQDVIDRLERKHGNN